MHIKYEDYKYDVTAIEAVSKGTFDFNAGIPVSNISKFDDNVWDWRDKNNERTKASAAWKVSC